MIEGVLIISSDRHHVPLLKKVNERVDVPVLKKSVPHLKNAVPNYEIFQDDVFSVSSLWSPM